MSDPHYDVVEDLARGYGVEATFGFRVRMYLAAVSRYLWERAAWAWPTAGGRVFCYRRMGLRIGRDVFLGAHILFDKSFPERIEIRDHAVIGDRCIIFAHANLPSAGNQLRAQYPLTIKDVVIGEHAWLMPSCIVNPGVTIGDHSVVATGAVVTASVPPRSFVAPAPSRTLPLVREMQEKP
jgi:acetyltransferase-like isoleucine patch superfamily enzyme